MSPSTLALMIEHVFDAVGRYGTARRAHLTEVQRSAAPASLAMWQIEAAAYHPAWAHYLVCLAHLRDVPGAPPPKKHYPAAEYELLVLAAKYEGRVPDDPGQWLRGYLEPPNLVYQFHGFGGATDGPAVQLAERYVRAVCDGLSPDTDFRRLQLERLDAWLAELGGRRERHRSQLLL